MADEGEEGHICLKKKNNRLLVRLFDHFNVPYRNSSLKNYNSLNIFVRNGPNSLEKLKSQICEQIIVLSQFFT